MSRVLSIDEIKTYVEAVVPNYDVKKVTLYGDYADEDAKAESVIKLLVEFNKEVVSLFVTSGMKLELEDLTGKAVDLLHAPVPNVRKLRIKKEVVLYGH